MKSKNLYGILIQSLKLVASNSEVQIALLPEFLNVPDEIALIYNDAYLIAPQLEKNLISASALDKLKELDELFENMSHDKNLWTIEKLKNDGSWKKSRELGLSALSELKESYNEPNLEFINWIK